MLYEIFAMLIRITTVVTTPSRAVATASLSGRDGHL